MTHEEFLYISELNYLTEQYSRTRLIEILLAIFCFITLVTLSYIIWTLIFIVCILLGIYLFNKLGITTKEPYIPKKELAHRVCVIMDEMIDFKKNGLNSDVRILTEEPGTRPGIYAEFITLYPSLESKTLKKLAHINQKNKKTPQYYQH